LGFSEGTTNSQTTNDEPHSFSVPLRNDIAEIATFICARNGFAEPKTSFAPSGPPTIIIMGSRCNTISILHILKQTIAVFKVNLARLIDFQSDLFPFSLDIQTFLGYYKRITLYSHPCPS
jgi:hypothetical protein